MKNIFENAQFGDKFRTRDGQKVRYCGKQVLMYICELDGVLIDFFSDGTYCNSGETNLDIVSEWQEIINDEELEMLAFNNYCNGCSYCESANAETLEEKYEACQKSECYRKTYVWKLINGYKAGYRKALEKFGK